MISNKLNKKPFFPYTYGDEVKDDGNRLSDYIVVLAKNEQFQKRVGCLVSALYIVGSNMQPAGALPPEVGEGIANLAEQVIDPATGNIQGMAQGVNGAAQGVNGAAQGLNGAAAANNGLYGHNPLPPNNAGPTFHQPNSGWNYDGRMGGPPPGAGQNLFNLPGPPKTVVGKSLNTMGVTLGVTLICLNGYWGNPFYATLCAGIVFDLAQNLVKKTIMR